MKALDKHLADLVFLTLPVALLYFAGIIYLTHYLNEFSIQVTEVSLTFPLVLSFAFNVVSSSGFFVFFALACVIVLWLVYSAEYRLLNSKVRRVYLDPLGKGVVVAIVAYIAFLMVYAVAVRVAKERAILVKDGGGAMHMLRVEILQNARVISRTHNYILEECRNRGVFYTVFSDGVHDYRHCASSGYNVMVRVKVDGGEVVTRISK